MNVLLQRHKARNIYSVPNGLRELMSDISREVLRNQPKNIYQFIANYLECLMLARENLRVASSIVKFIIDTSILIAELLENYNLSLNVASKKAKIISKAFREYWENKNGLSTEQIIETIEESNLLYSILEDLNLDPEIENTFIIQDSLKNYKKRHEIFKSSVNFTNWRKEMDQTMEIYKETDVSSDNKNVAATKIQAAYRGYYTRKNLKKNLLKSNEDAEGFFQEISLKSNMWRKEMNQTMEIYKETDVSLNNKNEAATKIQAAYRGYYTRKNLKKNLLKLNEDAEGFFQEISPKSNMFNQKIYSDEVNQTDQKNRLSIEEINQITPSKHSLVYGGNENMECLDLEEYNNIGEWYDYKFKYLKKYYKKEESEMISEDLKYNSDVFDYLNFNAKFFEEEEQEKSIQNEQTFDEDSEIESSNFNETINKNYFEKEEFIDSLNINISEYFEDEDRFLKNSKSGEFFGENYSF